ncbi:hypothetical protein [Achromobacter phage Motura]|uniref:Uncharacterized protein n=1 Tax=Achromobacter phage Motura TaxID=2591403 RepID=A0A514CT92_9CAUD|nr:hypothetical protein H1O15_gp268 [Achromobacter phage Motura]QDH83693.1 hypothetical protein [Achromobacter phage Motura]
MSNLRYKDMSVSKSSAMGQAMLNKASPKVIEQHYREGNAQFHRDFPKDVWERLHESKGLVSRTE